MAFEYSIIKSDISYNNRREEISCEAACLKKLRYYAGHISNYAIYIVAFLFFAKIYLDKLEADAKSLTFTQITTATQNDTINNKIKDDGPVPTYEIYLGKK